MNIEGTEKPSRRLVVAQIAVEEDDDQALVTASTSAMVDGCDDPQLLIDAGHELLAAGRKRRAEREGSSDD